MPARLPFVQADIAKLDRVFSTLIENDIRHTPEHGSIHLGLALSADGEEIQVTVSDNGCGIPRDDLPHLFEPYYQAANHAGSDSHQGNGLGLAIAKRLLD